MDICKLNWTVLSQEIFALLCLNAGQRFSQRDIAKMLKVSPTAIANSLKILLKANLVKIEKTKTINFVYFNRDERAALELKRIENLKIIYLSGLSDFLEDQLPGATIILFGSYFRGEDTTKSDIDIAVIGRKHKLLNLEKYEVTLKRKININYYDSWKSINQQLKNNILTGIVIHGGVEL